MLTGPSPFPKGRIVAIFFISDQKVLSDFALHDSDVNVRIAAARRISNPSKLASVLLESQDDCFKTILFAIRDEETIVRIALAARNSVIRFEASDSHLTDSNLIAKVAIEGDWIQRKFAVEKLIRRHEIEAQAQSVQPHPQTTITDHLRIFQDTYASWVGFPEAGRRADLCREMLRLNGMLREPVIAQEIGEIVELDWKWNEFGSYYNLYENGRLVANGGGRKPGEAIKVSMVVGKFPGRYFGDTYYSLFGSFTGNMEFTPATINPRGILKQLFSQLSATSIDHIASESKFEEAREAAIAVKSNIK